MGSCWHRLEDLDVCYTVLVGLPPFSSLWQFSLACVEERLLTKLSSYTTQAYALAFFLPIILNTSLGFSVGDSQLLGAPPYVGAGIIMAVCAWFGDKFHLRGPSLVFCSSLGLIGLPILVSLELLYPFPN